jgi:hypothetical protein
MEHEPRIAYVTRDNIQRLLSDDEVDRVSMAETAAHLESNDEYIDLTQLEMGVQNALGNNAPMGHVLPRKAIREITWRRILAVMESFRRGNHQTLH